MPDQPDSPVTALSRDDAFAFLDDVARGLAQTFGPSCETLVQEIEGGTCCRVLSIYNGQVSGRTVGSTLSIYGDDTTQDTEDLIALLTGDAAVCTEATTLGGQRVKSSSWMLRGADYALLLGVNLNITALAYVAETLTGLASVGSDLRASLVSAGTAVSPESLIDECLERIGQPAEALSKPYRQELVRLLAERGFFDYHRATAILAGRIGVSRNTIYNDLRALK